MIDLAKVTSEGQQILEEFVRKYNLEGAMVVSADGFDLASYFANKELEPDLLAANVASIHLASQDLSHQNQKGDVKQIIISTEDGEIAIQTVQMGEMTGSLVIVAPKGFKMGILVVAIKQLKEQLKAEE